MMRHTCSPHCQHWNICRAAIRRGGMTFCEDPQDQLDILLAPLRTIERFDMDDARTLAPHISYWSLWCWLYKRRCSADLIVIGKTRRGYVYEWNHKEK